jgi:hypothetical protein
LLYSAEEYLVMDNAVISALLRFFFASWSNVMTKFVQLNEVSHAGVRIGRGPAVILLSCLAISVALSIAICLTSTSRDSAPGELAAMVVPP